MILTKQGIKQTNSPENWSVFRSVRNQVVSLIKSSKENYFTKLACNLNKDNISPKNWRKLVKKFISSKKTETISFLIKDDKYYSSSIDKANVLNEFFCNQSNLDDYNALLPLLVSPLSGLDTIILSNQDVLDVLKNLDINKASGPDLVNPRLLKEGAEVLSPHLVKLFNSSLSKSYFPDNWKVANVVPIYKKGDKTSVTNYRPISLLSCIGKTFQKCVFKHMYNFLLQHKIITSLQSGFTPGDSSVYQLIDLYNTFTKAIDDGKEIRTVFCDISKAFDRVWHKGLMFKLRRIGIGGPLISWFKSYLDGRKQRVAIEGSLSNTLTLKDVRDRDHVIAANR